MNQQRKEHRAAKVSQRQQKQLQRLQQKSQRREENIRSGKSHRRRVVLLASSSFVLAFLLFGAVALFGLKGWQDFNPDKILEAQQTLRILDQDGNLITLLHGGENRQSVSLSAIPQHVVDALIATEDIRFYEHHGLDIRRIFGALWADIRSGSLDQGASTLTQQLIKLSHLTNEKTFSRKIQEALLALQMERQYSKNDILEMYFNYVYFGAGAYGIEAASREYFSKSCSELTLSEGALLVGVLKSPTRYAPHLEPEASVTRRNLVLDNMERAGFLTQEQVRQAKEEPLELNQDETTRYPHGFYVELAMKEAREQLGISQEELLSGGYCIETALDSQLQTACEELFADGSLFPEDVDGQQCQGALVVMNPETFEVRALMGGREHMVQLGLNRAVQLPRQPGSAIKPVLVYAPALETFGYTAATYLLDEPEDFSGYQPRNFGDSYNGVVTLRTAIQKSLNVPAVRVLSDIGLSTAKSFAKKIGIPFDEQDNSLSLALGGFTHGVTTLQLCEAYSSFAAGGLHTDPTFVRRITDREGKELYTCQKEFSRVMGEDNAFILTDMLKSVVQEGTGRRLNIGIPLAAKTGTTGLKETGGNKDAWVVAYNPEYVAALWMGYDNTSAACSLPSSVTGGTYPAALLARLFSGLYPDVSAAPDFEQPAGVVRVRLDGTSLKERSSVLLASALTPSQEVVYEYFTQSTAPTRSTDYWVVPSPPGQMRVDADTDGKPVIRFTPKERFVLYRLYRSDGAGQPVLLEEYPGDLGEIVHRDETAQYGLQYDYYVVPIHPEQSVLGEELIGPESRHCSFTVALPVGEGDFTAVSGADGQAEFSPESSPPSQDGPESSGENSPEDSAQSDLSSFSLFPAEETFAPSSAAPVFRLYD